MDCRVHRRPLGKANSLQTLPENDCMGISPFPKTAPPPLAPGGFHIVSLWASCLLSLCGQIVMATILACNEVWNCERVSPWNCMRIALPDMLGLMTTSILGARLLRNWHDWGQPSPSQASPAEPAEPSQPNRAEPARARKTRLGKTRLRKITTSGPGP